MSTIIGVRERHENLSSPETARQEIPMSLRLTRRIVEEFTVGYHRVAGGTRPDLRIVEIDGFRLAVKDFHKSDQLFREIVGPILIRREYGALAKLKGVDGVPTLVGRLDRFSVAMEHIGHRGLYEVDREEIGPEFFECLAQLVHDMHARGVCHCDLRSRGNVLFGNDGLPYVVDFAACVYLGRGINPVTKWIFKQFVLADNNAVLRVKRRLAPHLLTDDERLELATPLPYEAPAHAVGASVRKLTRTILTRKREAERA